MKYLIICLLLSGCTITAKLDEATQKQLDQHSVIINALVNYVQDCQEKGVCPKPEAEEVK